jgi:hypothetical protein
MTTIYLLFGLLLLTTFWTNFGGSNLVITSAGKLVAKAPGECPCCQCAGCNDNAGGPDIVYAWNVTLSGFADNDCANCEILNDSFTLDCAASAGVCTWKIDPWAGTDPVVNCEMDTLDLKIIDVGGEKILTVSVYDAIEDGGECTFERNFGEDFNCCDQNATNIPHKPAADTKADCTWTTPTCAITARCCPQP